MPANKLFPPYGTLDGTLDPMYCPNHTSHVSAFPAADREPCPGCGKRYVKKVGA